MDFIQPFVTRLLTETSSAARLMPRASSLSDLKEIGCKSVWLVYISPLFRPIEQLLAFKIVKIYPHPVTFSLRFFKSDRLLDEIRHRRGCEISVNKPWLELYYSQPQREAYDRTGVFS
jgi:hypothetical protein